VRRRHAVGRAGDQARAGRRDGAQIVVVGTASDERQMVAEQIAAERGLAIIPPYDDDRIIAGQGTIGLEIVEALPDVGRGPSSRSAAAGSRAASRRPSVRSPRVRRLVGVEPELAADAQASLAAGEIVRWPADLVSRTIADGNADAGAGPADVRPPRGAPRRDRHGLRGGDRGGVRLASEESRLVAEPSGALSVAALAFRAARGRARRPRWPGRGGRFRRQRRPGALPRVPRRPDPGRLERA
jgi:threonine dehydratase